VIFGASSPPASVPLMFRIGGPQGAHWRTVDGIPVLAQRPDSRIRALPRATEVDQAAPVAEPRACPTASIRPRCERFVICARRPASITTNTT